MKGKYTPEEGEGKKKKKFMEKLKETFEDLED